MSLPPVNTPSRPATSATASEDSPPLRSGLVLTPTLLWGAAWGLAALLLVAYAFKRLYPGDLVDGDAMDFAQIARNIANGHGFATSILRPLALSGFVSPDARNFTTPDISRAPLYPLILMLAFVAHGGHGGGNMVVLTSLLFFLASAAAVYALARTVFPSEGQPWLALLSCGLYLLSGSALIPAVAGLPVSLATLLVCCFCIALFRAHETGGRAVSGLQIFGVGVLLGLCYLTQYSLLVLLVPTLAFLFATRASSRAWSGVGWCAAGFVLVTLPWLVRTVLVTHGSPFFTLLQYGIMTDTSEYPGQSSIYRSVLPAETPFTFFFAHLPEMLHKAGRGLAYYQTTLPKAFPILVLAPALASLLWRFPDIRVGSLRGFAAVSLLLLVLVTVFFAPAIQMLACFAPVVIVIGVGFVFQLMARQQWRPLSQRVVLWTWGCLAGVGLLAVLIGQEAPTLNPVQKGITLLAAPSPNNASAGRIYQEIARKPVMTDTPWEVAWRTGWPALWLPRDNQTYEAIVKGTSGGAGSVPAPSILLTPNIAGYSTPGEAPSWLALARDPYAYEELKRDLGKANDFPLILKARIALAKKLMTAGKLAMTPTQLDAQIAQAQAVMPTEIKNARSLVQQRYDQSYGPISEIVANYGSNPTLLPRQQEADGAYSTLFLRRDFLKSLQTKGGVAP